MMAVVLAWALVATCLAMIVAGLSERGGIYGFPFLAGATFLGFVAPQVFSLGSDRFLPADAVMMTLAFTIACAAMCALGWYAARTPTRRALKWHFDDARLLQVAAAASLIGAFFFFRISRLPEEVRQASMPEGTLVIYLFFARMMSYGFIIAVLCCVRRFSLLALAIILFDSIFLIDRILVTGKRGELAEFGLAVALAFWFQRGVVVPRTAAVAIAIVAAVLLSSAEDYRKITHSAGGFDLAEVADIDVIGNFESVLTRGGPEMRNAVVRIDFVQREQAFDFGGFHWNLLVYAMVPGQIVGHDIKQALLFMRPMQWSRDYSPLVGSTETGMADAFGSFWYFGAVKFFVFAYLLARIYRTAMDGWLLAQIVYIASITPAMHTITHYTQWLVTAWVNLALMLLPLLLLARASASAVAEGPRRNAG